MKPENEVGGKAQKFMLETCSSNKQPGLPRLTTSRGSDVGVVGRALEITHKLPRCLTSTIVLWREKLPLLAAGSGKSF